MIRWTVTIVTRIRAFILGCQEADSMVMTKVGENDVKAYGYGRKYVRWVTGKTS